MDTLLRAVLFPVSVKHIQFKPAPFPSSLDHDSHMCAVTGFEFKEQSEVLCSGGRPEAT